MRLQSVHNTICNTFLRVFFSTLTSGVTSEPHLHDFLSDYNLHTGCGIFLSANTHPPTPLALPQAFVDWQQWMRPVPPQRSLTCAFLYLFMRCWLTRHTGSGVFLSPSEWQDRTCEEKCVCGMTLQPLNLVWQDFWGKGERVEAATRKDRENRS